MPVFCACIKALFFSMCVLIAICANFYLSDTSEYLEFSNKEVEFWEYIFLVVAILALLIGFFVIGYKHYNFENDKNYYGAQNGQVTFGQNQIANRLPYAPYIQRDATGKVINYKDPNFKPLILEQVYDNRVPPSAYL